MMPEIKIIAEIINIELTQEDYTTIFIQKLDKLSMTKTMSLRQQLASEQQKVLDLKEELAYIDHKLKRKTKHWDTRHQNIRRFDATRRDFDAIKSPNTYHSVKT